MKASRAPGPVSYMHLHAAKGKDGTKNEPKPRASKSAPAEAGGVLRKFKDIDNIPDFSWGESEVDFHAGRCLPSKSAGTLLSHDRNDKDSDDFNGQYSGQDDRNYGHEERYSRPLPIPQQSSFESPRHGDSDKVSRVQRPQKSSPKDKLPLSSRSQYSSDEDNFDVDFRAEQKVDTQLKSLRTSGPPPLPIQLAQQKVQSRVQQQEQKTIAASHAKSSSIIANNGNSGKSMKVNRNQHQPVSTGTEVVPDMPGLNISVADRMPPLPCEKPLNQPKETSAQSPTNLTDQDKLYFTKQPRNVEFK